MKAESPMRKKRKELGLKIQEVADGTGLKYSTVQFLDSGHGADFSLDFKKKIAAFLGADFFSLWPEELKKIHQLQMFAGPFEETKKD